MSVRKITEYPAEVLGQIGKAVLEFNKELEDLCVDMFDTMYDAEGVGLAAPQIGLSLRLFVMDCDGIKLIAANPGPAVNKNTNTELGTGSGPQLYRVSEDPGEKNDLAPQMRDKVRELSALLDRVKETPQSRMLGAG